LPGILRPRFAPGLEELVPHPLGRSRNITGRYFVVADRDDSGVAARHRFELLEGQLAMTISSGLAHLLLHSTQRGPSVRWRGHCGAALPAPL